MDRQQERRAGAALVRATKPFSEEDIGLTWRLFATTVFVYAAAVATAMLAPWWPVQLAASVVAGLTIVRLFIFYHDYLHGAIFRDSALGHWAMVAVGWGVLSPPKVWKQTHDYHHQNNAKMIGASIGSFPTVSTQMWRRMTPGQRFWYKVARNPLTIVLGYVTVFMGGMCFSAFARDPKEHWEGPAALLTHFAIIGVTWTFLGFWAAFFGVIFPLFLACAAGTYLFYAQHNFPDCEIRSRDSWVYAHAALKSSSMFDMNPVMHWFTGNIGYHHVHHLNHKIPFYRLPEAMAAMPELQSPGRTSWHPRDMLACLQLKLWDSEQERFVGWEGIREKEKVAAV